MLSAGILIGVLALVAVAALYVAVRVHLAGGAHGTHGTPVSVSEFGDGQFGDGQPTSAQVSAGQPSIGAEPGEES
jgi:hypothetical protein